MGLGIVLEADTRSGAGQIRSADRGQIRSPDRERNDIPIDGFISGHQGAGQSRAERPAIVPLGNIMHEHADGRLLGFALVMPKSATPEQWRLMSQIIYGDLDEDGAMAPLDSVRLGGRDVRIESASTSRLFGLSPGRYAGVSARWSTVTPILLSRRPDSGRRHSGAADPDVVGEQVMRDCALSGLPRPVSVEAHQGSSRHGVMPARAFRQNRERPPRWATHATVLFDRPVRGPILVGAGRYSGFGLMVPVEDCGQ